ncbi:MAG: YciI family protein [Solirubrobacteraceae bacterium]
MPQYMLLIYGDPADAPGTEEQEAQYGEWLNYTNALVASGAMVSGAPLEAVDAATTVRVRNGDTVITDGPFADTKEILGGYYLVDVPDLDAALALAAQMPNIEYGSVEVRPVVVFPESG